MHVAVPARGSIQSNLFWLTGWVHARASHTTCMGPNRWHKSTAELDWIVSKTHHTMGMGQTHYPYITATNLKRESRITLSLSFYYYYYYISSYSYYPQQCWELGLGWMKFEFKMKPQKKSN